MKPRKIRVRPVWRKSRGAFSLRWIDPVTNRPREQVTDLTQRRKAEDAAAEKASELTVAGDIADLTWERFRKRYESEDLPLRRRRTRSAWGSAVNRLEAFSEPRLFIEVDASYLSRWVASMAEEGLSPASQSSYLGQILAGLGWAESIYPSYRAPKVKRPKKPKGKRARARPVTKEELERMLTKVPDVVGATRSRPWRRFLWGLWYLGRRIGEVVALDWQRSDRPNIIDIDGVTPMIRIPHESAKGGRNELFPIQPDAVAFLRRWPKAQRRGRVFRLHTGHGAIHDPNAIGRIVSDIGQTARVRTGTRLERDPKTGKAQEVPKWASAHDLRRSFGSRWAPHLKPRILQLLMGHKSYQTTQEFYEELDVADVAKGLWAEFGSAFLGRFGEQTGECPSGDERPQRKRSSRKA
jgi:integrase